MSNADKLDRVRKGKDSVVTSREAERTSTTAALLREAAEIMRDISDPKSWADKVGVYPYCTICGDISERHYPIKHTPDCPVRRARKMLDKLGLPHD